jgi:N-acetylgalactosamine-N,N'-diacetylbacillosaminyl-diphospho-undecaprenol 4-alpha-N-acetylgalactosaminyltransferase
MNREKITIFLNSLTSGGAEKVVSVVVNRLVRDGHSVELICIERDDFYKVPVEVERVYLSNLKKEDSGLKKLLYLPLLAFKLKKHIKRNNIKLIQSHIYRANFTNIISKLFGSKHKVEVVEVISITFFKKGGLSNKINLFLIKKLYRYADLILFKAQRMKTEFLKNIYYRGENIVINNPYDIERITLLCDEKIDDFIFDEAKKYIVNIGRLEEQKNQITLIESLTKMDKNVELIIMGDGSKREELEEYAKRNALSKRVHLLGNRDNPFKYIKKSDVFVLASREEGFPNVLIEAMICGVPVISTDCISGPREILAPKSDIEFQLKDSIEFAENGILYPVDDMNGLVEALDTLFHDSGMRDRYVKKALEKSKEFSVDKIVEKYKGVLCVE